MKKLSLGLLILLFLGCSPRTTPTSIAIAFVASPTPLSTATLEIPSPAPSATLPRALTPTVTRTPTVTPAIITAKVSLFTAPRTLYTCVPSANIRAGPSVDYPVVATTTLNAVWTIYGQDGEWYYAGKDEIGNTRFIHQSLLCVQPTPLNSPTSTPTRVPIGVGAVKPTPTVNGICPITTCNDGTCSSSTGRGTCSHHGGIRK